MPHAEILALAISLAAQGAPPNQDSGLMQTFCGDLCFPTSQINLRYDESTSPAVANAIGAASAWWNDTSQDNGSTFSEMTYGPDIGEPLDFVVWVEEAIDPSDRHGSVVHTWDATCQIHGGRATGAVMMVPQGADVLANIHLISHLFGLLHDTFRCSVANPECRLSLDLSSGDVELLESCVVL